MSLDSSRLQASLHPNFSFKANEMETSGVIRIRNTDYHIPQANIPVGGRLKMFASQWEQITQHRWVIQILFQGYLIEFKKSPPDYKGILEKKLPLDPALRYVLTEEVNTLLQKSAIEKSTKVRYSKRFLQPFLPSSPPKKDRGVRPILNLRPLNRFVSAPHFKMQTLKAVLQSLNPNDWVTKLDLKDAYFHIPIHPKHRKFLRFAIQGQCYQFKALCIGLASAPRVFTKVMAILGAKLHAQQVQVCMYLDDWLIIDQCKHSAS